MLPERNLEDVINDLAKRYGHFEPSTQLSRIFGDGTHKSLSSA
jgi:hypothetical protein